MSLATYLKSTADALTMTDREAEAVEASLTALRRGLAEHFEDAIKEQITFGSFRRRTNLPRCADPYSDVDHMVVFREGGSVRPRTLLDRLKRFADERYRRSVVTQSSPAVVVILNHTRFDLVPAYKDWLNDYRIPARKSDFQDWVDTEPNDFNLVLDRRHRDTGYQMKPLIRLVKYWNAVNGYPFETHKLEKSVAGQWYPFCTSLPEYLFSAFDGLSNMNLRSKRREAVERALKIISETKRAGRSGVETAAQAEIQRLLPPL